MNKVLFKEFLSKLSDECTKANFVWHSQSEKRAADIVIAQSSLESGLLHFSDRRGQSAYGHTMSIDHLPYSHEWITAVEFRRSLTGPSQVIVRTFI